jgi:hypothetical protein
MSAHTSGLDAFALPASELRPEILVQRLLLPLLPKPQRLASFQITHYRQKFIVFAPVDLVHPICFSAGLRRRWSHRSK